MTNPAWRTPAQVRRRRHFALVAVRVLAKDVVLVVLYFVLPLDRLSGVPLPVTLAVALVILLAVAVWQLRTVLRARYPAARGIEALASTVPLFLLLFASAYVVMARATPASFSEHITRTDSLYFTIGTFTTVGYGDITAVSQAARVVVTVQMILDLLALGLGIRVFVDTVQVARRARRDAADPGV